MPSTNAAVDAYIAKAAPFAQPILNELRSIIHASAPNVTESMKWSMPFFVLDGVILGNMSAFKQHCSFGLWGAETVAALRAEGVVADGAMGSFGRITSLHDLPSRAKLRKYVRIAAGMIESGTRTKSLSRPANRVAKPAPEVPAELAAALKKNKAAQKTFDAFSPSCKREYVDWITDAKREETRQKRLAEAVAMMSQGKRRNWKYESC